IVTRQPAAQMQRLNRAEIITVTVGHNTMRDTATYIKLILILIFPIEIFGQSDYSELWRFLDLKGNNISEVTSAEFEMKKNGRLKDSTMIYQYKIDTFQNKLYGVYRQEWMTTHGKLKNPYHWQYIEQFHDSHGRLIKDVIRPREIVPEKEYGSTDIDSSWTIQIYEYDKYGKRILEVYQNISKSYSVSKYTKDTFFYQSGEIQKYETVYNQDGKPVERYHFRSSDSLRYKNVEWIYNEKGLLTTWISYTRTGEFHTKRFYSYNENDKLVKQIDSTGWYINDKPTVQKIIDYEYLADGTYKEIHQMNLFREIPDKWSITYNSEDQPIKNEDLINSSYTVYEYLENDSRKEITYNADDQKILERIWEYNNIGFLIAEYFINHGLPKYSKVTKYYYK
ncbi:hypothetical protein, partial [Namhaeicola litoreus]